MKRDFEEKFYFTMKHTRRLLSFSILFLVARSAAALTDLPGADLRLALGDEVQEKRTTAVNWPIRPRVAKPAAIKVASNGPVDLPTPAVEPAVPPSGFRVLVDVGHGGHDFGAPGHFGILEKDLCLKIAGQVKARLERLAKLADFPLDVRLSRESDGFIALRERVKTANEWNADLFISIHANSSPVPRARGFEVYFLSNEASDADASRIARLENGDGIIQSLSKGVMSILSDVKNNTHILESSRFAEAVYSSLAVRLRPNGKGVRQAPFTVLQGTQMPALLIEVGYLTNAEEAATLAKNTYQQRIATGISEGVLEFAQRMRRLSKSPSLRSPRKRTT